MSIRVVEKAHTDKLTSLLSARNALSTAGAATATDPVVEGYIAAASSSIAFATRRRFGREIVIERIRPSVKELLRLSNRPVSYIGNITIADKVIPAADYTVASADSGTVEYLNYPYFWMPYKEDNYEASNGLRGRYPFISVEYVYGYLLPADDIVGRTTISFSSVDNSFNDSGGAFPIYVPGDIVMLYDSAFTSNNGAWVVVSRTASKLVVTGAAPVVDRVAGDAVNLTAANLPAELTTAANLLVVALAGALEGAAVLNPSGAVASEKFADMETRYSTALSDKGGSLLRKTSGVLDILRNWTLSMVGSR